MKRYNYSLKKIMESYLLTEAEEVWSRDKMIDTATADYDEDTAEEEGFYDLEPGVVDINKYEAMNMLEAFEPGLNYLAQILVSNNGDKYDYTSPVPITPKLFKEQNTPERTAVILFLQLILQVVATPYDTVAAFGTGTQNAVSAYRASKGLSEEPLIDADFVAELLNGDLGFQIEDKRTETIKTKANEALKLVSDMNEEVESFRIIKLLPYAREVLVKKCLESLTNFSEGSAGLPAAVTYLENQMLGYTQRHKGCAKWVNIYCQFDEQINHGANSAWGGWKYNRKGTFITKLKSTSLGPKLAKIFTKMVVGKSQPDHSYGGEINQIAKGQVLDSGQVKKMKPGNIVGFWYDTSSYQAQAFYESATNQVQCSPGESKKINFLGSEPGYSFWKKGALGPFFEDQNGDLFDPKRAERGEYGAGTEFTFSNSAPCIPALNSHIGICVGSYEGMPVVAHNVGGDVTFDLYDASANMFYGGYCKVLWIDTSHQGTAKEYAFLSEDDV